MIYMCTAVFLLVSCSSFINKDRIKTVKAYEEPLYTMKAELKSGDMVLAKGKEVRLYITTGKDYVKVYVYPTDVDFLKARRVLVLYLFEEDFEGRKFNAGFFEKKLFDIVQKKK